MTTSIGELTGYAVLFHARSALLGDLFYEEISPTAAADLAADDQYADVAHDSTKVLGRRSAGTLTLTPDAKGIRAKIDVPDTTFGRDALESFRRRDVPGWSFLFRAVEDDWRLEPGNSTPIRLVTRMRLLAVSPLVAMPAYPGTASARGRTSVSCPTRHDRNDLVAAKLAVIFLSRVAQTQNLELRMRARYTSPVGVEWRTVRRPTWRVRLAQQRQRLAEVSA